ncbi:hypothetical protein ACWEKT_39900 [Nocardia takedensis]
MLPDLLHGRDRHEALLIDHPHVFEDSLGFGLPTRRRARAAGVADLPTIYTRAASDIDHADPLARRGPTAAAQQ